MDVGISIPKHLFYISFPLLWPSFVYKLNKIKLLSMDLYIKIVLFLFYREKCLFTTFCLVQGLICYTFYF